MRFVIPLAFCLLPFAADANSYIVTNSKSQETPSLATDCEIDYPSSFRLSVLHREANGIGYNQGYSSVDAFVSFGQISNVRPFFDLRAHIFNNGNPAANIGFGIRYELERYPAIVGVNGFFDFRATSHSSFEQIGCGIEILGTKWGFRSNGYFPIINDNNLYSVSFSGFQGHQAIFMANRELSFRGFDVAVDRILFQRQLYNLSSTAAGYFLFADEQKEALGGLFKLKSNISQYFSLEAQFSYDTLFKAIVQGQIGLSIPFGKKIKSRPRTSCFKQISISSRLAEPVERLEIIATTTTHTPTVALDVRTRLPLYMVFVNNLAPQGNGTAENPYGTLLEAEINSKPSDMIYVYGGQGTLGMDVGITLKDSQWLQASSSAFDAFTEYGFATIPAQTSTRPTIGSTLDTTVTLANYNIIKGFNILSQSIGITGSNIQGFLLNDSYLSRGSSFDVSLVNVGGPISLINNTLSSKGGLLLSTSKATAAVLEGNIFSNSGFSNFSMTFTGSSISNVAMSSNTFSYAQETSLIASQNSSRLTIDMESNRFSLTKSTVPTTFELLAEDSSSMVATVKNNDSTTPCPLQFDFITQDSAISHFYVIHNTGTYTGSDPIIGSGPTIYTFSFKTNTLAESHLLLTENYAGAEGYLLSNESQDAIFTVQSPTLSLEGLTEINTGTFTITGDGTIEFTTYLPSEVPYLYEQ